MFETQYILYGSDRMCWCCCAAAAAFQQTQPKQQHASTHSPNRNSHCCCSLPPAATDHCDKFDHQSADAILKLFKFLQNWKLLVQVRDQVRVAQVLEKLKVFM